MNSIQLLIDIHADVDKCGKEIEMNFINTINI